LNHFGISIMPSTRSATGNSRPRVLTTVDAPARAGPKKGRTTKKTTTTKPKGVKGGRVTKKTTGTAPKRKPTVKDKVSGAALKAEGALTGHEGKKAAGTKKIRGTTGKPAHTKKI